jgi:hypothetical protein
MLKIEELQKIRESLTDLGDIVWNDMDSHDPKTIRNLDESIEAIDKAIKKCA